MPIEHGIFLSMNLRSLSVSSDAISENRTNFRMILMIKEISALKMSDVHSVEVFVMMKVLSVNHVLVRN